jgi:CheY-like chemotaxis protein
MSRRYSVDELRAIYRSFEDLVEERRTCFLAVDKQIATRKTLLNCLRKAGVESDCLFEANDAISAITVLQGKTDPFVIFLDIKLSDADSLKFMARVHEKRPKIRDRFVLVSNEVNKKQLAIAAKLGTVGLLTKPINQDEMIEQLKKAGAL